MKDTCVRCGKETEYVRVGYDNLVERRSRKASPSLAYVAMPQLLR